ncbi:nuclear transport factor 2 family protein [Kitasatospora sp. GAS204B]|uniref:nuclear transport factor 2 family protein n=1 Tax=unclassified Kitasatospora TaxID=2633591 RepID=UPI0024755A92|nr:nuclear transport factor 2 family protein [Kitasatospora sp. GAS204B]MDH6121824.1 ketosteroid isomerase-like protein [Kitasatospora sp. GAS204B]
MTEATNGSAATPVEVVERLRKAMEVKDRAAFVDEFAADGVYELPFSLAGAPSTYTGIDEVRALLVRDNPMSKVMEFNRVSAEVHQSTDPEVVTVEFTIDGKNNSSGESFTFLSSVGVIRVRDGKIVHYRDYPSMLRGAQVAGMLKPFAESLAK